MSAARTTTALLFVTLTLAVLDVGAHLQAQPPPPITLVSLPGFDPSQADRITLGGATRSVVLERRSDGWWIAAPTAGRAHQPAIEELLGAVSGGIEPEARVDDGDHGRYGLSGGGEMQVTVEGEGATLLTFVMGHDAGGGSTWVRWAGSDDVYRARIGGRATYDRSPRAWRDLAVTRLDPAALTAVRVRGPERFKIVREGGEWTHPWRDLDGPSLRELVARLASLTALEVAAPRFVEGDLTVQLDEPGRSTVLTFEQVGELWFVGRQDRQERWRVAHDLPQVLMEAPESLANRSIWPRSTAPVIQVERERDGQRDVISKSEEQWVRVDGQGDVVLDATPASAAAVWLSGPRVRGWAEGGAAQLGFPATERWTVTFADGRRRTLELGMRTTIDGLPHLAVRSRRRPKRIGWVDERVLRGVQGLFVQRPR